MGDPRFVPATFAKDPKLFGDAETIEWAELTSTSLDADDQLVVAKFHNTFAFRVKRAMRIQGITMQEYAERTGYQRLRVSQLLNGLAVLRLEDIVAAHRELGVSATFTVGREEQH